MKHTTLTTMALAAAGLLLLASGLGAGEMDNRVNRRISELSGMGARGWHTYAQKEYRHGGRAPKAVELSCEAGYYYEFHVLFNGKGSVRLMIQGPSGATVGSETSPSYHNEAAVSVRVARTGTYQVAYNVLAGGTHRVVVLVVRKRY